MIMTASLSLCLAQQTHLQDSKSIYYFEDSHGYPNLIVPYEDAVVIDFWGRKGISAEETKEYLESMMEQIRIAKITSDSIALSTQFQLNDTRYKVVKLSEDNAKLIKANFGCQDQVKELEEEKKKLKKKLFWHRVKDVAVSVIAVVAILFSFGIIGV